MLKEKSVVITGMGMVTALGDDVPKTWDAMSEGMSGVRQISLFNTEGLDTKIAAEVDDAFETKLSGYIKKREAKKMTRLTRMSMVAVKEAVEDSKIDFTTMDRTRVAVIMGVVTSAYNDVEREKDNSHIIVKSMPNSLSAWISLQYGLLGPNFTVSTACASSAYAIYLGKQMIQSGCADVVIVGGADSHINRECISGFNQIMALSTKNDSPSSACRPFDSERDGFVMGEGAGILILESEENAKKRNAKIYAEIAGAAITSEAFDITAPQKEGTGMEATMRMALENAGIEFEDVDYINAHGTSTHLNDLYETMAIKRLFRDHAEQLCVSSTKSMTGHTIGAAGAIECIISALTIQKGMVLPTINYKSPEDGLDLNYVPNKAIKRDVCVALSNSFGFGGHNASIVLKKMD